MNPVIMPYLDCAAMTDQAIKDCLNQTIPTELLLVDNGSQPPARAVGEKYAREHPGSVLLWVHDPPFRALGALWNRALRFCWEAGADHAFVVNNDVRLHPGTYAVLLEALHATQAWFITGVSVTEQQFDPTLDLRAAVGLVTDARRDGVKPEGYSYGGPDFSCYLITRECHARYKFDEGFVPAYGEDCSYHRVLMLDGHGNRIFGVNVPFLHYGSATLKAMTPERQAAWEQRITQGSRVHYQDLWGGQPNAEEYITPRGPDRYKGVTNPDLQRWTSTGRDVQDLLRTAEPITVPVSPAVNG